MDGSSISAQEFDIFTKPVTDPAGRRISAPDFRKDRQSALAKELLKPKYQVYGFKTADLHKNLSGHFRNPAQIRINPMISMTMKNDVLQFAAQLSQIEESYDSIQR